MKRNVLIIGAGGVAQVVAHKCAQANDRLGDLHIASRTLGKCEAIIASVHDKGAMKVPGVFAAHAVDAMDAAAVAALIRRLGVQIVINVGSSFVNMRARFARPRRGTEITNGSGANAVRRRA
jgi:saccharopine dehydrogenase-like NADP-dependent oxidoreductase